jgi:hypothetical protein
LQHKIMIQHLSSKLDKVLWFLRTLQILASIFKKHLMWLSILFFMKMTNTMKDTQRKEVNVTNCWSGLN